MIKLLYVLTKKNLRRTERGTATASPTPPKSAPDFMNEVWKEPAVRLSGKLSCNWLIMLVIMATPISFHVKDKNSIFTARDKDMIF